MTKDRLAAIRGIFEETAGAHHRFAADRLPTVLAAADAIAQALLAGRKVLSFGNGGSASDAEHLAAELVGRFEGERRPLPAIALTADSSIVTAISNDYGYDHVFERQIGGLGVPGDVAFGISTSGGSKNVELALIAARRSGLVTIAMTGRDGGRVGAEAEIHLNVAEPSTPRIQEVHRTIMHGICSLVDLAIRAT
jgi:D-sedoheptulose 7-phosphate isomerase